MPAAVSHYVEAHYPKLKLIQSRSSLDALHLVSEGSADAAVENIAVSSHLIRKAGLGNLKITGATGYNLDPTFGVRDDFPILRGILEKAHDAVSDRERLLIFERWVLVDVAGMWTWRQVIRVGSVLLVIGLAVTGGVLIWNRRLGRELEKRRIVEEALRQSEEQFRHLFETMEDAYILTHVDGRIQFVNETAVSLFKIVSRPVIERLRIETFLVRPGELAFLLELLRGYERLRDQIVEFSMADGTHCVCCCQMRLIEGPDGQEIGVEWLVRPDRVTDDPVMPGRN